MRNNTWLRVHRFVVALLVTVGATSAESGDPSVFDMSLEELLNLKVSVASRRDEIVREAPAVVTIVTREEIEALGARNLMDIINRLPSMQVVGHAGFYGNKTQIRAQPNSSQDRHTLILINGRPVRENINGGNNAYFYLGFPISTIESIEIIRGPGSVLYGSNAFAAVINIKTRSVSSPSATDVEVGATYGTFDTQDYNAMLSGATSNMVNYLAAVRISRSEGPEIGWTDNANRTGSVRYKDDADSVFMNIGSELLSLQTAYNRYSPGEFGTLGTLNDAIYISEVETFFADAGLSHHLLENLSAHLNLTLNTFSWHGSNDGIDFFERRNSRNLIVEPMLKYAPLWNLNLVVGGTVEYDKFGGRELFERSRYIHSVYAQADYQLNDWLKPLIGLQYNKTEEVTGNTSPRLGLVITPGHQWGMKLLYSEAFRRAYAAEGYLNSSFLLGNPGLEPETIKTYEAQLNYQNRVCLIDLTFFHSSQNVIEVDGSTRPLRFINHPGDLITQGVELTGRVKLGQHWQGLGSTIIQSTDNGIADILAAPNYPDYMIKGGLLGKYGKMDLGVFNSYFSDGSWRHEKFNNLQANVGVDISRLLGQPADHVKISLYADNILDETPFHRPSDVGLNEPLPHYYEQRLYATLRVKW